MSSAVFTIKEPKIPDRDELRRPDQSRSYLSVLPARYEQAKMQNVVSRSLRRAANETQKRFEGASQVYTG